MNLDKLTEDYAVRVWPSNPAPTVDDWTATRYRLWGFADALAYTIDIRQLVEIEWLAAVASKHREIVASELFSRTMQP